MSKKTFKIIGFSACLLALALLCAWVAMANRQRRLDSALFVAVRQGTGDDVGNAIKNGGRINATERDLDPVYVPSSFLARYPAIRDSLASLNMKWNGTAPAYLYHGNNQPIHAAAAAGNIPAMQSLLDAGASVTAQSGGGYQPLHCAVQQGWPGSQTKDAIAFLVASGADVSAKTTKGKTAADMANSMAGEFAANPHGPPGRSAFFVAHYRSVAEFLNAAAAKESSPAPKP